MTPKNEGAQAKTVGLVMVIMLAGKLTGLYRDILFGAAYGTETVEAQAFTFASNIPRNFLDFAFASAISASFIPIFNTYLEKRDREQAFKLANNFITLIVLASGIVTVLGIMFSASVADILVPGYLPDAKALSSSLLKIMMVTIVLSGAAFSLTGVLQSLGEFNVPAAMSVLSNCLIIFYYLFLIDRFGVFGLSVTFILGWATQVLIQIPSLIKRGYRYKPFLNLRDGGLGEIGRLTLPVLISSWVMPVNFLVNNNVASALFDGAGAVVVDKANQLYSVITGIFILSIANVVFPKLSKQRAADDLEAYGETLRSTVSAMLFFLIPMTAGLFALSGPIVRLVFNYGLFNALSTERTAVALGFYAFGMVGFGLQTILSRGFYAAKDGVTPMLAGLVAIALNFALSYSLVGVMGIAAPAFASSMSINAAGLLMLFIMGRKNKGMFSAKMLAGLCKMLAACAAMLAAVYGVKQLLLPFFADGLLARAAAVAVPVAAGVFVYLAAAVLLKTEETSLMLSLIRKGAGK